MRKPPKITHAKCLALWSKIVRTNANHKCEWCGSPATEAHHMVAKKTCAALKFDVLNGVALCAKCHFRYHRKESFTGNALFMDQRPLSWACVQLCMDKPHSWTTKRLRDVYESLSAELARLEAA